MGGDAELALDWAGLPVIATVARLPCHAAPIGDGTPAVTPSQGGSRSRQWPGHRTHRRGRCRTRPLVNAIAVRPGLPLQPFFAPSRALYAIVYPHHPQYA